MKRILFLTIFLTTLVFLPAVEYRGPDGISFDLPEGWEAFGDAATEAFSFANASRNAFMQVFRFTRDEATPIAQVLEKVLNSLGAHGDRAPFLLSGRSAIFASVAFTAAGNPVAGYAVCVRTSSADTAIIVFGATDGETQEELLSALDSVAFSNDDLHQPGPVSQFMLPPGEADATAVVSFGGFSATFPVCTGEFEVAQMVVEREAKLLARSGGENIDTWKRFYRVIYRDGYERISNLGERFAHYANGKDSREVAEELLAWIQGWSYERTGTLADLMNPYEAALRESGDCDSRGLVYATLLHYAGIEASLLVSQKYSHSICSVGVSGNGAVIATEKGSQIVAETTDSVAFGLIASDQADPAEWTVVDLDGKRGPR